MNVNVQRARVMGLLVVAWALMGSVPLDSPVADAAMKGDIEAVRALLSEGADVNAAQGDGMTALHWAAERADATLTEMLLFAGAYHGAVTRIGSYTPLHLASKAGSFEVAERLLQAGADAKAVTTNSGATPLHLAAIAGDPGVVRLLVDAGADVDAIEAQYGQTPLVLAASMNRADAIRALLASGADPNIATRVIDVRTESALQRAASDRRNEVLDALRTETRGELTATQLQAAIAAGRQLYLSGELPVREERDEPPPDPDEDDDEEDAAESEGGLTALIHAARQGHVEAALALLEGGADVNQVSVGDGSSPLLIATINGQFDLAMVLLEHGADPNLASTENGVAPLWAAVNAEWQPRTRFPQPQEGSRQAATYLDLMSALLDAGADPDARTSSHPWYMVYSGCGNRNCGLADTRGSTAFWRAAYATDVQAMRLLVARGADPSIPTLAPPPRQSRRARPTPPDSASADSGRAQSGRAEAAGGRGQQGEPPPQELDPSGLPPVPEGGPGVSPIHAAAGVGYGEGFAGNAHRHAPEAWLSSVRYLIEELGADVNLRDHNGYTPLHHAAARGDDEMILYLVGLGADVTAVSRRGQTVADMANGPVQRIPPFPETVALLERLGSKNSHRCVSC